jgi:hypothetical protein
MNRAFLVVLSLTGLSCPAMAVQKCIDEFGVVTFSDQPCPADTDAQPYRPPQVTTTIGGSAHPDQEKLIEALQEKRTGRPDRPTLVWEEPPGPGLSPRNRQRLEELATKKRELLQQLSGEGTPWQKKMEITRRIKGVDREMALLRASRP